LAALKPPTRFSRAFAENLIGIYLASINDGGRVDDRDVAPLAEGGIKDFKGRRHVLSIALDVITLSPQVTTDLSLLVTVEVKA
jgi:hypothetical protein